MILEESGKEEKEKLVELQQWKNPKINNKQDLKGKFEDSEYISKFEELKIGRKVSWTRANIKNQSNIPEGGI